MVFRDSLFALNQSANIFKSLVKVSYRYARLLEEQNTVVSSANRIVLLLVIDMGKSFVYIMNSNGPRTDPCGTPEIISWVWDLQFLYSTYWLRFFK